MLHPNPPTKVVVFPERCDDTSNASVDKLNPAADIKEKPQKRAGSDLCFPKAIKICLSPLVVGEPHLRSLYSSTVCSETLNVLQTVQILLVGFQFINQFGNLYLWPAMYFTRHDRSINRIVCAVTDILTPYAALEPDLCQDICASNQYHPVLLQLLKPVVTTGDGKCFHSPLQAPVSSSSLVYGLARHHA